MIEKFESLTKDCGLCPRNCGVNRMAGETGFCGASGDLVLARAALHFWEEPCISGEAGSGTVFFSYCNLGCVFCQNREISRDGKGKIVSVERLSKIFLELQNQGANNINLVTAVHYVPWAIEALDRAKTNGLKIPVVYNSSGYESAEVIKMLEPYVDVYLPDFKYMSADIAARASGAADYPDVAKVVIREMLHQKGAVTFNEKGIMTQGVIIRHMVLPGHTKESIAVLKYIAENYGTETYISLLSQYTPMPGLSGVPGLDKNLLRRVTAREYEKVVEAAIELGFTNAFVQERTAAGKDFIPDFNGVGV